MNYTLIETIEGSKLLVENTHRIVKVSWSGVVQKDVAVGLLTQGAELIASGAYDKIVLDRKDLVEFTTEARLWIKNDLFKNQAKQLVSKVAKMAIIEAHSKLGAIMSNLINAAIKLLFPGLSTKKFRSEQEALAWIVI